MAEQVAVPLFGLKPAEEYGNETIWTDGRLLMVGQRPRNVKAPDQFFLGADVEGCLLAAQESVKEKPPFTEIQLPASMYGFDALALLPQPGGELQAVRIGYIGLILDAYPNARIHPHCDDGQTKTMGISSDGLAVGALGRNIAAPSSIPEVLPAVDWPPATRELTETEKRGVELQAERARARENEADLKAAQDAWLADAREHEEQACIAEDQAAQKQKEWELAHNETEKIVAELRELGMEVPV